MNAPSLILLFHVHTNKSHDSSITVREYIDYLENTLRPHEYAVLGISDHNCIPLLTKQSCELSTKKVLIIPGIQWKLKKSYADALSRLITRRELLTFGEQGDLADFVKNNTGFEVDADGEILGNCAEDQFLKYIRNKKNLILIVPHPRHIFFDYYGVKEIARLKSRVNELNPEIPFFVEEKTGYDPFPRILYNYKNKYLTLGWPDAHEIFSFLHTKSLFSVEVSIRTPENQNILRCWSEALQTKDHGLYLQTINSIFRLLIQHNNKICIKKHYIRTWLHFLHSIPAFLKRRFNKFPRNLLR